jgi:hypothetical protein
MTLNNETAGAPAWMLLASGLLTVIYSVIYFLWTAITPVTWFIGSIGSWLDGSNGLIDALMAFLLLAGVPLLQLLGFVVTGLMGIVTMWGGWRLNTYRSRGVVWLAVLCSTGAPGVALVVNAFSALNLGAMGMGCFTGCLFGNIPTVFLGIFGLIASVFGAMHLSSYGYRFE